MTQAAKRRKKEEPDFVLPEFDEVGYMKKEMEGAKVAIIAIILAVPVAALLYAITLWGIPIVAFFLGLGITAALPRIFRLLPWPKTDLSAFERKDWLGHGATFFFTWIAFWILFLNVPFVDVTAPVITSVSANGHPVSAGTSVGVGAGSVTINATVLENGALEAIVFDVGGNLMDAQSYGGSKYYVVTTVSADTSVKIIARDAAGHEARFEFTLDV